MRILHCIYSLHGGGAETQLALLAEEMSSSDNRVAIFFVKGSRPQDSKVEYIKCAEGSYPFGLVRQINKAVRVFNPEVMQAWVPVSMNIATLLSGARNKVPVISSIRNRRHIDGVRRLCSYLVTLLLSNTIISNNPIEQSSWPYRLLFKIKRGVVIENAVKVDKSLAKLRRSNEKSCKLIYVGRLTKQKNLPLLLSALSGLESQRPISLDIYGQGEDERFLKALIVDLGLSGKVMFHGFSDSIHYEIAKADFLVLPSLYEGMPNVVVEALALGVPALVSDIPAHTLLFKNQEVAFFESDNVTSLKNQLSTIINQQIDIENMMVRSAEFVASRTVSAVAQDYVNSYKNVLKSGVANG